MLWDPHRGGTSPLTVSVLPGSATPTDPVTDPALAG
jgi:hypothetical protein